MQRFLVLLFAACICAFGCGLEEVETLEAPVVLTKASEDDPVYRYFSFITEEVDNSDVAGFNGTDVFYKIYQRKSDLTSETNSILSVSKEYSPAAADRMLKTYNYQRLQRIDNPQALFLKQTGANRKICIRLYTEESNSDYGIGIFEGDEQSGILLGYPARTGNLYFNDTDNIETGDVDVKASSKSDEWYVAAFAVCVGIDQTLQTLYSDVAYLGSIYVKKPGS